jgi:hypothetical protein
LSKNYGNPEVNNKERRKGVLNSIIPFKNKNNDDKTKSIGLLDYFQTKNINIDLNKSNQLNDNSVILQVDNQYSKLNINGLKQEKKEFYDK